jgi:glucose-6-phosphate 1-dehydrogenase
LDRIKKRTSLKSYSSQTCDITNQKSHTQPTIAPSNQHTMNLFHIKDPFILTIFGASGDLAKIKIFPALYRLMEQKRFPKDFYIVGFARSTKTEKEFRKEFYESVAGRIKSESSKMSSELNKALLNELLDRVFYFQGQYDQKESFEKYREFLKKLTAKSAKRVSAADAKSGAKGLMHIAYCSVPPQAFKSIIQNLGETKTATDENIRLVIEKPFGQDLESATDLFHFMARYFDEKQIYLLDHYLGKSAVQSILYLRHSNRILNHMMKSSQIANIQITAFEDTGVSNRIGYFEQVGIIKDMIQSHLLQLLALVTMSIPITMMDDSLHREKNNILSSLIIPKSKNNIVLGQYQSYKKETNVPKGSKTETFAALRLFIDRESWYKIPIYIRTGKKLHEKHTYITIEFKKFKFQDKNEQPNVLIIELYPEEKLNLKLLNQNGYGEKNYKVITTSDSIACTGDDCLPEHGSLLLDVFRGNKMQFLSFPEIIASWKITEEIIKTIKEEKIPVEIYKDDSSGPESQKKINASDHFRWCDPH